MKKANLSITILIVMVITSASVFGQENKKAENARKDIKEAKQDLREAKIDSAEDYQKFRKDAEMTIKANDQKIMELKEKKSSENKEMNEEYNKKVQALEMKNNSLKRKLETSSTTKSSGWASFKREFNHDMNELGHAFKDIGVNNAK